MTKSIWITDPHFNFVPDADVALLAAEAASKDAELVIVTGDIAESHNLEKYLNIIEDIAIAPWYFVLGNHDFYGSSIFDMWQQTRAGSTRREKVKWLTDLDVPVRVNATTALIGDDGWYDGRSGNYFGSMVYLADFDHVEELKDLDRMARLNRFISLAEISVKRARPKLIRAFDELGYKKVVFATHVPPYPEAAWHQGKRSGSDWVPFFSCQTMGDMLNEVMDARPDKELLVLCGHTHSPGMFDPRPNIQVETGGARYGRPAWSLRVL